jgi:dihydrofolate reductase
MRKIIASLFMTLDGVVEAPGSGDTTLEGKRGWSDPFMSQEIGMLIMGQMDASDAMLLGRRTYQDFAAFWPSVPDEDPFGKRMNGVRKYVLSTTLQKAEWNNSTLIQGNVAEALTRLKAQPGQNISVVGSGTLVQSLLQLDLIDELQLMVVPVFLGIGKRLFPEGSSTKVLKLVNAQPFSSGMVLLSYAPADKA